MKIFLFYVENRIIRGLFISWKYFEKKEESRLTRTRCRTSSFSSLDVKLVSLFDSTFISLLLSNPARLARVELVGLPTETSEPRLPPKDAKFPD